MGHLAVPLPARHRVVDTLLASVAAALDVYDGIDRLHRHAVSAHIASQCELCEVLEEHVAHWIDVLAARAAQLGADASLMLDPSVDTTNLSVVAGAASLPERYAMLAAQLRASRDLLRAQGDGKTARIYADVLHAAEVDGWFVEVDLGDDLPS